MRAKRSAYLVAGLPLLLAVPALAQPVGGAGTGNRTAPAAGHEDAAAPGHAPARDAPSAPPTGTAEQHGSHATKRPAPASPGDAGQAASHGRRNGPPSGEGAKGGAQVPAIDARQFPGHRPTSRPIKDLLPKPYRFPKPAAHVRPQPPAPVAPANNAIGIPLGHAPIAKPVVVTPPPGTSTAAKPPSGGIAPVPSLTATPRQTVPPPMPPLPRNPALNGTAFTRIGTGPATVGGVPRTTTGINGTSIRPKHGN